MFTQFSWFYVFWGSLYLSFQGRMFSRVLFSWCTNVFQVPMLPQVAEFNVPQLFTKALCSPVFYNPSTQSSMFPRTHLSLGSTVFQGPIFPQDYVSYFCQAPVFPRVPCFSRVIMYPGILSTMRPSVLCSPGLCFPSVPCSPGSNIPPVSRVQWPSDKSIIFVKCCIDMIVICSY